MSKLAKTLSIIGLILVFFILFGVISGMRQADGHKTPGIFAFILMLGLIAGIRAIYKSGKKSDKDETNLQK